MTTPATELAHLYAAALRAYLADGDEGGLQRAYEIGRKTIAEGLGVMDLAKAHEEAVVALFTGGLTRPTMPGSAGSPRHSFPRAFGPSR